MSSQRNQGDSGARTAMKCNSTGGKKRPTLERVPTTTRPFVLSRSSKVISKDRCSPSLRLKQMTGNTQSRKSESLKNKTRVNLKMAKTFAGNHAYPSCPAERKPRKTFSPSEIFKTPPTSPQMSEYGDIENEESFFAATQKTQEERELQMEADSEMGTPTNSPPVESNTPSSHEKTLLFQETEECSGSENMMKEEPVSVTTPRRTPCRQTARRSFSGLLETNSLIPGPPTIAPIPNRGRRRLRDRFSTSARIEVVEEVAARLIMNEEQDRPPTLRVTVSPIIRRPRNRPSVTEDRTLAPVAPSSLPLGGREPEPGTGPNPPPNSNGERSWPSWRLPEPIAPPMHFPSLDHEISKYHRPVVIASSFYNWFIKTLLRGNPQDAEDNDSDRPPIHMRQSIKTHYNKRWFERDLALSKTILIQHLVYSLLSSRGPERLRQAQGYQPSPQARRLLTRLKQQGRQAIRTIKIEVVSPAKAVVEAPEFWMPLVEVVSGQAIEFLISSTTTSVSSAIIMK